MTMNITETATPEARPARAARPATAIRPLTLSERKKPSQLTFIGCFKNVSFQIGEIVLSSSAEHNTNATTPVYSKAVIKKSPTIQLPIMVPNALPILKGMTNTIASVVGQKNIHGGYDAILVARGSERMSSFNSTLRTVKDLLETLNKEPKAPAELDRLGKSSSARTHNQVMLAGMVVAARFEDGENPKFIIQIRQDANPNNVIPLIYEAKNASAMQTRVVRGALIYVDGEYAFRNVPIFEMTEDGKPVRDAANKPVIKLDANGKPAKRLHTYIRITAPKDPAEFDTDFKGGIPPWMVEFADQIAAHRATRIQKIAVRPQVVSPIIFSDGKTPAVFTGSIDDL